MKWALDCFEAIVSGYYEQSAVAGTRNLWMYVPPIVWKLQNVWSLTLHGASRVSRISRKYGTYRLLERPGVKNIRSFWRHRILRTSSVSGTSIMSGTSRISGSSKCLEPQERPKIVGNWPPLPPPPPCLEPPDVCKMYVTFIVSVTSGSLEPPECPKLSCVRSL